MGPNDRVKSFPGKEIVCSAGGGILEMKFQPPWFHNGVLTGFGETSVPLPVDLPDCVRG